MHTDRCELSAWGKGHLRRVMENVIPNQKVRKSYLLLAERKYSKMICFVDEFREIIGDNELLDSLETFFGI